MLTEILGIAAIVVASTLAWCAIWSRKETKVRGFCVLLFALLIPLVMGTHFFALSHSGPVVPQFLGDEEEYHVIRAVFQQDVAIWLLLWVEDEPRLYHLPWDNDTAQRINRLMGQEAENGTGFFMRKVPPENESAARHDLDFEQYIIPPGPKKRWPKHKGGM